MMHKRFFQTICAVASLLCVLALTQVNPALASAKARPAARFHMQTVPALSCEEDTDYAVQATAAFSTGEYEASLPLFLCATWFEPLNMDLQAQYFQALFHAGQYFTAGYAGAYLDTYAPERWDGIIEQTRTLAEADPTDETAAELYAASALFSPEQDSALARLLELNPDNPYGLLIDGLIQAFQKGDLETAAAQLDRAVELAPDNAEVLTFAGNVTHYGLQNLEAATTLLNRAIEADPGYPFAYMERASIGKQSGRL